MTRVHSAAGCPVPDGTLLKHPPFRAPHHQSSLVSLVGGGSLSLRPGEVSLATHGVLFLDELGEFPVAALEALRQPLEEGVIRVSRAGGTATFPAAFLLVAAMNPCPCGEGVYEGACTCTTAARARYRRRISAPLLDRFDLVVPLSRPDPDELLADAPGERSSAVAVRVAAARARLDARRQDRAAAVVRRRRAPRLQAPLGLPQRPRAAQGVAGGADGGSAGRRGRGDVRARVRSPLDASGSGGGGGVRPTPRRTCPRRRMRSRWPQRRPSAPPPCADLLASSRPSVAWLRTRGRIGRRPSHDVARLWRQARRARHHCPDGGPPGVPGPAGR